MKDLKSPLANVISNYELDESTTFQLDNLVCLMMELNGRLDYDRDYDIEVYLENALPNEEVLEEEEYKVIPLYNHLRKYAVDVLKRYGMFVKPDIVLDDLIYLLTCIEELFNLDPIFVVELKDEIHDWLESDKSKLSFVFNDYTSLSEDDFYRLIEDCNDKLLDYLPKELPSEAMVEVNDTIINKLSILGRDFLHAPILKEIIKLGNTRYPDIHQYFPIYAKTSMNKNRTTKEKVYSLLVILMHVDKEVTIHYDVDKQKDPSYYLNLLNYMLEEDEDKDNIITELSKEVKKVRGIKL